MMTMMTRTTRPTKYKRKDAGKSKTPIIIGAVAGVLLLVGGVVGLVIAFSGSEQKPVAQNDPPAQTNPPPKVNPPVTPNTNQNPPDGNPDDPPVGLPAGGPTVDVFARAASFKPDGPLPELPPLPPVDRRPMLVLDPGGHTAFIPRRVLQPGRQPRRLRERGQDDSRVGRGER